jgi:hypothetical protein
MTLTGIGLTALSVCGVGWLVTAATLVLDLLGRLPGRLRRNSGLQRPQRTAGLAMITALILAQVGELAGWPRATRVSLDLLAVACALILLATVLVSVSPRRRAANRPSA